MMMGKGHPGSSSKSSVTVGYAAIASLEFWNRWAKPPLLQISCPANQDRRWKNAKTIYNCGFSASTGIYSRVCWSIVQIEISSRGRYGGVSVFVMQLAARPESFVRPTHLEEQNAAIGIPSKIGSGQCLIFHENQLLLASNGHGFCITTSSKVKGSQNYALLRALPSIRWARSS